MSARPWWSPFDDRLATQCPLRVLTMRSINTAAMIMPPMAEPCQNGETPSRLRPLRIITMMNTPISVPMMRAAAAKQARAADHHGGDGVEFEPGSGERIDRQDLGRRERIAAMRRARRRRRRARRCGTAR